MKDEFTHNGFNVRIEPDPDPEDPSDGFLGKLAYRNTSRYVVGNEPVSSERLDEIAAMSPDECVRLPLYAYVHSGTVLNTTGFSCPWDSGQCGFAYVEAEDVKKEYGVQAITPEIRRRVEECLKAEVESFSNYLGGGYYGYVVEDEDGDQIDSCWGFDDYDYCVETAKEAADYARQAATA
jgi:hypothetical protein